jgi:uncharacterized membrane protein
MDLIGIISNATDKFPAARIVWVAIAMAAAAAFISGLGEPETLMVGGIMVVVLIVCFCVVLALYHHVTSDGYNGAGMGKVVLFLAWSFSILLVVFLMALLFYFFTGQTNSLSQGLAIRGNSKSLIPSLETLIEEPNELDQETIISISVPESQAERAIRQGTGRAEKAVDDCLDSIKGDQLTVAQFEKQARGCLERD